MLRGSEYVHEGGTRVNSMHFSSEIRGAGLDGSGGGGGEGVVVSVAENGSLIFAKLAAERNSLQVIDKSCGHGSLAKVRFITSSTFVTGEK